MAGKYEELSKRVDGLESNMEETQDFNLQKHTNETRSKIANTFVSWFFYIIGGGLLLMLLYNGVVYLTWDWESTADIKIVLVDISSALPILISAVSGPLGFVVGYYFKTEANK